MKILNLYAGIGGNRKLWNGNIEVTAIEKDSEIAKIYQQLFPFDKVIIIDAHQFLLEHYKEFDFIWSSPPCPSHSRIRKLHTVPPTKEKKAQNKAIFPDMKLYEEILFLDGYFKGKWIVENVISWYKPLIKAKKIGRHYFWSNFIISNFKFKKEHIINKIQDTKIRNAVNSELGEHILKMAFKEPQLRLEEGIFIHKKINGFEN